MTMPAPEPTTVLSSLRRRLETRAADAMATYWAALARGASGKDISERQMEALLDEIEHLAPGLGKTADAIEGDLAVLRQFLGLGDVARELDKARAAQRAAMQECAAAERDADQLVARAQEIRREVSHKRETAAAIIAAAESKVRTHRDLAQKLAAAGRPAEVAAANAAARAAEIESLRGELKNLDAGTNLAHESAASRRGEVLARLLELGAAAE